MPASEVAEIKELATDIEHLQKLEMSKVKPQQAEDEDLLVGLKELDNKEKADLNKKRENFTPRQEKKVEPKE